MQSYTSGSYHLNQDDYLQIIFEKRKETFSKSWIILIRNKFKIKPKLNQINYKPWNVPKVKVPGLSQLFFSFLVFCLYFPRISKKILRYPRQASDIFWFSVIFSENIAKKLGNKKKAAITLWTLFLGPFIGFSGPWSPESCSKTLWYH